MRELFSIYRYYAQSKFWGICLLIVQELAAIGSTLLFGYLITLLSCKNISSYYLWGGISVIALLDIISLFSQYRFNYCIIKETASMARKMKEDVINRFMQLDTEQREREAVGTWERRICMDTQLVAESICPTLGEIAGAVITFALVCFVMVKKHPIFLILIVAIAICFLFIFHLNKKQLILSSQNVRTTNYEEGSTFIDFLALTPIMRLFRVTKNLIFRFSVVTRHLEQCSIEAGKRSSIYTTQIRLIMVLGQIGCLALTVIMFQRGILEVGTIVAYTMLVGQISGQMGQMVFSVPTLTRGAESARALEKTFGILSNHDILKTSDSEYLFSEKQRGTMLLSLQNVSFTYRNGPRILKKLNWKIHTGEYHSILGNNGEGKSTLIRIILGTLREGEGRICRYFSRPGYVPQTTAIFQSSFLDNITLFNHQIKREQIEEIIRLCRLEHLLNRLGGLDATISQRNLSGGEIQRIGIARALAINPDLLIVDEITNNLDIFNKSIIFQMLRELKRNCTIISISHDMEIFTDSDYCWILHKGELKYIPGDTPEQKQHYAFNIMESNYHAK